MKKISGVLAAILLAGGCGTHKEYFVDDKLVEEVRVTPGKIHVKIGSRTQDYRRCVEDRRKQQLGTDDQAICWTEHMHPSHEQVRNVQELAATAAGGAYDQGAYPMNPGTIVSTTPGFATPQNIQEVVKRQPAIVQPSAPVEKAKTKSEIKEEQGPSLTEDAQSILDKAMDAYNKTVGDDKTDKPTTKKKGGKKK